MYVNGQAKINNSLNSKIDFIISIRDKNDFTIHLDSNDLVENFQKVKIPFSSFFGNTIKVNGIIKTRNKGVDLEFIVNLYDKFVNLETISIN